jgi:outer membrane protein assembly factor BamB
MKHLKMTTRPVRWIILALAVCALGGSLSGQVKAGDWPQFLGPNGDGSSAESGWNQDWNSQPPRELWRVEVGMGCSSVTVADGRLYTMGNRRNQDTVWCLDAETGGTIWSHEYRENREPKMYTGGPSATPLVSGGKVYTVSKSGLVLCLDATTGRVLWQRNYPADFGGSAPSWGYAASAVVSGGLVLLGPGAGDASVLALNKDTGEEVWRAPGAGAGYAPPVLVGQGEQQTAVWFKSSGLVGHRVTDGRRLFDQDWKTSFDVNASRPLEIGGNFLIGSGYGSGAARVNLSGTDTSIVWKQPEVQLQFQNAVHQDGFIYAVSGDNRVRAELVCVDFKDGRIVWRQRLSGNRGNVLLVDGKLLALSEQGELVMAEATPQGYRELGQLQVLPRVVWAPPALVNGRFYARNNDGRLVALDLR